jgi:hypothetical protein
VPGKTGDQLLDLFRQRAQAASEETVCSEGKVSAEQLEELERLSRLVGICETAQPSTRLRWPVMVALGSTLLLVSILLFARVPETEVELELTLSEVGFVLPTQQRLTLMMEPATLGVSGLQQSVEIPRSRNREAYTLESSSGLKLSAVSDGARQGTIDLASLPLPAKTHIWIQTTDLPRQYRISLGGTTPELRVDLHGPVQIRSSSGVEQLNFATPQRVLFQPGGNYIDLDLSFLDSAKSRFSSQLSASDLAFVHRDEFFDTGQSLPPRDVSTILSGTIYFVSINDQERKLRPSEMINMTRSEGDFRTLRLQDDRIELKYHGRVRGLSVGMTENRRSLMPTWFEWLRARHSLFLLWSTTIYLFGLIIGVLRWLGKSI